MSSLGFADQFLPFWILTKVLESPQSIEVDKRPDKIFNIKKTKIMASSLITSWQIEGEKVEAVTDFIFLGFAITADSDCSCEIKSCLLLRRKAMTNLDSVLESRDITFADKDPYDQSYGFSSSHVWM